MLVMHANRELEHTFQTLIKTMGVRVDWNGRFVVMGDLMILEGAVRSLYFQFDNRQVITNIIDININPVTIIEISEHPKLANLINMILYAFGKWGTLAGLKVDKDYDQLNQLFRNVLQEYYIEPMYRKENFRFFKDNIRITYEDVFQLALDAEEHPPEEPEELEEEESQGLWHKLVWKKHERVFRKVKTTLAERYSHRIGHNFYMVGYLCPKCTEKLHMVVYPVGKEQRIETEEKGVYISRAYTCDSCNCFYTPRPGRLLMEGDAYEMHFGSDRKAYEDYLELLGKEGARTSNYRLNEYEAMRNQREQVGDTPTSPEDAIAQMESYAFSLDSLPDDVFQRFTSRVEDSFYPDALVETYEPKIHEQIQKREKKKKEKEQDQKKEKQPPSQAAEKSKSDSKQAAYKGEHANGSMKKTADDETVKSKTSDEDVESAYEAVMARAQAGQKSAVSVQSPTAKHYQARVGSMNRMSKSQRADLKREIERDKSIDEAARKELLRPIREAEVKEAVDSFTKKTERCINEKNSYAQINQAIREIEEEPVERKYKEPFLKRLFGFRKKKGAEEVKHLMDKLPKHMDRETYKKLEKKLADYPDVDLTPYAQTLHRHRETAETEAITDLVNHALKSTRDDCVQLMRKLEDQQFADENVAPYMEKLQEKIRAMDEERIEKLCKDAAAMDYETAATAYEEIENGSFLPKLKENALEKLSRRLEKLKTDECELLVQKFREDLEGKIRENKRFHFYPAKKVMMKKDTPEETAVINYALGSYAGSRSLFEYPILVVDTSRNHSGKEGMTLTPDHLFYNTKLSAYKIPIREIDSIKASTGLLNRKITVEERNTAKHKLPYAVGNDEMKVWAEELENFIHYLQEKPQSRQLNYLARETHTKLCCFRCGYVYQGTAVCPKCGYKKNV